MIVRRRIVGLVVAPLIGLGACSGGAAPTPAEYRRAVRLLCRDTATATKRLSPPSTADAKTLARFGAKSVTIQREALRRIQKLDAPAADEPRVAEWLDRVGSALDRADASLAAQRRGDLVAAARANSEGAAAAKQADAIATELDLAPCVTTL